MLPASKSVNTIVLGLALVTVPLTPALANDAVLLLNQMHDALHRLEYKGKLVYVKDGEVTNLSISHVLEDGVKREVVVPLDENSDEYIRETANFSLTAIPKITPAMQQVYSFDLGGMGKVAGRPCRIVLARPKDRKRYLQKYCIDIDRSVLLKYSLINQYHQPVERFMFTDFEVVSTPEIAEEPLAPAASVLESLPINTLSAGESTASAGELVSARIVQEKMSPPATDLLDGFAAPPPGQKTDLASVVENAVVQPATQPAMASGQPDNYTEWFFDPLPAGFRLVSSEKLTQQGSNDEQVVISDGLSSVSVFITDTKGEHKRYQPISSGALNILTEVKNGYYVTLMGEVPQSTLQDIFAGLKRATIKE